MSSVEKFEPAGAGQNVPKLHLVENIPEQGAYQDQQQAFHELEPYPVRVLRRSVHKDLGETEFGRFTQESVRFDDGAVRLLTRGSPNPEYFGAGNISPFPISEGDPLFTGPKGLNEDTIEQLVGLGFEVIWLHHQGRHAPWPTNPDRIKTLTRFLTSKSVGKSAHHDHALLDDLEEKGVVDYSLTEVIRGGFSRSAMSGEAFIAEAPNYERTVVHSDLTAKCFAHYANLFELVQTTAQQAPHEALGLAKLARNIIGRELGGERGIMRKYAGTFDIHPMNLAHELAWIPPLISGDDGVYSRAIPLDTRGVRVFLSKDGMSHYVDHQLIHSLHPNLAIVVEKGAHIEGAHQIIVDKKIERFRSVIEYMRDHDMSLTGIQPEDYLPLVDYTIVN